MSFQSSASDLSALFLGLHSDLNKCKSNLSADETSYWDRMYIRCLFSLVEGITYRIRHALISAHEAGEATLTPTEYMLLSEIRYRIAPNGTIEEIEDFAPFAKGLRFTFKTCCRVLGCAEYEQSAFAHNGWRCAQETIKVRDRLTHPKEPANLMVSGPELEIARETEQWFLSLASEVFSRMRAKYA